MIYYLFLLLQYFLILGSPNYAAPEVISGNLYAGTEVDVWSCGVILYALLCGTLPFDDESIPNLFKKIKSGMYSLPSHLSQSSRDLILRMLVVDPMKRITIPEVRQHAWFQHKLPAYLSVSPDAIELQEKYIDDEIVAKVCLLPIKGVTAEGVTDALQTSQEGIKLTGLKHELKVAYQLLLDSKRHKLRIADVVLALQDTSRTPPGQSPMNSSRHLAGQSPSFLKLELNSISSSNSQKTSLAESNREAPSKRRRWYLGIQSKKDPAHVMTEVYKAMQLLNCTWHAVNNFRVVCQWVHVPNATISSMETIIADLSPTSGRSHANNMDIEGRPSSKSPTINNMAFGMSQSYDVNDKNKTTAYRVKMALSLYKVQQNIYLLDFQRVEVRHTGYMNINTMKLVCYIVVYY